jgi:hypothetical protein
MSSMKYKNSALHSMKLFKDIVPIGEGETRVKKLCYTSVLFVTFLHGEDIQLFVLLFVRLLHGVCSRKFVGIDRLEGEHPVAPNTRTFTVPIVHLLCCLYT